MILSGRRDQKIHWNYSMTVFFLGIRIFRPDAETITIKRTFFFPIIQQEQNMDAVNIHVQLDTRQ